MVKDLDFHQIIMLSHPRVYLRLKIYKFRAKFALKFGEKWEFALKLFSLSKLYFTLEKILDENINLLIINFWISNKKIL